MEVGSYPTRMRLPNEYVNPRIARTEQVLSRRLLTGREREMFGGGSPTCERPRAVVNGLLVGAGAGGGGASDDPDRLVVRVERFPGAVTLHRLRGEKIEKLRKLETEQ